MAFDSVENREIDLIETRVAIEIEMRLPAVADPTFEQLDNDDIFEETAAVAGVAKRLSRRDIVKPSGKSCIDEIPSMLAI